MLPGMFPGGATGGLSERSITLVDTVEVANNNSDVLTATVALGAVASGRDVRHIIFVVTFNDDDENDSGITFSSTLDGASVTAVNSGAADDDTLGETPFSTGGVWIGIIAKPTGTTGSFVFTISGFIGTMDQIKCAVYRAVNLQSATATTTPTGTTSITLVVPSNGFGVAGGTDAAVSPGSCGAFTGSGATTAYSGVGGAVMLRTASGSVVHDSSQCTIFRGATWAFA